ncbi:hybrid sensor histidine kinase/response regulator [Allocoleopsis sp.]|uniref:hybrid sensor histidine kinase/response regulator n=1 Tax=Allocoleopsis sp. TaxID=3088169 RepID=UPI002FD6E9D3
MNELLIHALLVEDSPSDAELFHRIFLRAGSGKWNLAHVERLGKAIESCRERTFDIALLDLRLPDSDGVDTVTQFCTSIPDVPVVILTAFDDEELALQAMSKGAQDYLVKDQVNIQVLRRTICYTIERSQILKRLKESEAAILQSFYKERELNQLKSTFISMVSHEFRNPLTTLRLTSQLLQDFEDKLTPAKKIKCFEQMNTSIHNMTQLLDEVMLLGKTEVGQFQYEPTPLNLEKFCRSLTEAMQLGDNNKHPISFSCQGNCTQVEMDEGLLRHILTNILSNALKYSPDGKKIRFSLVCQDNTTIFRIQDQGIGIPAKERNRLFETFSRCSNVGRIEGTGLGLAIVNRCVELSGGEIQIDSEVNVGTTVTVSLPLSTSAG